MFYMEKSMSNKIKIILKTKKMTITDLAKALGQSRQNLTNKLTRDNFTINELLEIAEKLDCEFNVTFKFKKSNEEI